jgi:diguanylate cyclase (GGDEF)-like protein/PAS domain S-box-containing protein
MDAHPLTPRTWPPLMRGEDGFRAVAGHLVSSSDLSPEQRTSEREAQRAREQSSTSAGERFVREGASREITRLFDLSSDLLATVSPEGRLGLLNPAWQEVLGFSRDELRAMSLRELVHPDDLENTRRRFDPTARPARFANFTNRYRHRDGSWRWLLWSARFEEGAWYASAKDITDRLALERQALRDPLTRLPNRILLMDRARQAIARLHRGRPPVAILFIDLDRFKAVNDTLGHRAGDELLLQVARRLIDVLRDSDTVARFGGDEFVILAEELEGDAEAITIGERVLHALEEPFVIADAEVSLRASVGVAVAHDAATDADDLLREADIAMYRAKGSGGQDLELFDERLRRQVAARLDIDERLRHALPRQELRLAYQPQMRLDGRGRVGWEALLRWYPHGSLQVEPAEFLPLARESRLIVAIGEWALRSAAIQAASWRKRERLQPTMSVNISARELAEGNIIARIKSALADSGLPAAGLCLEISEDALLADVRAAHEVLEGIRNLGVHIAIDNFGSGRSSLSLAASMPIDTIKIDRELIRGLDRDNHRRGIVSALVSLARETHLRLVATGIETERELKLVRKAGCPVGQGFLLSPPQVPA